MNGMYRIYSDEYGGYATIRVEEYKRPTFDIQFIPNEETYRFGDTVSVKGNAKTFSGINLQEANVQYKITRRNHWMFRGYFGKPSTQIAEGVVQTDADGSFEIRFPAIKPVEQQNYWKVNYIYTVEATVTDSNGETQSSVTDVYIGDQSMFLSIRGLDNGFYKEQLPDIAINAVNLAGRPVSVSGTYEIYSLKLQDATRLDWNDKDWMQDKKDRKSVV
jgi:uncharacterized protein YfaS (alpha-2-macroglobulin family)